MPTQLLFAPLLVAIVLVVVGRVSHRKRWGTWVAIGGYAVLAVTFRDRAAHEAVI